MNGNLLDYKLMTALDTPDMEAEFVELDDPVGPYGNKALGEPPAIPGAPGDPERGPPRHRSGL